MNFVYGSASVVHTRAFGRLGEAVREEIESWDLFPSFFTTCVQTFVLAAYKKRMLKIETSTLSTGNSRLNSVFPTFMQEGFPLGIFFHPTSFPFLHLLHAVLYYVDTFSPFQFLPPFARGKCLWIGWKWTPPL